MAFSLIEVTLALGVCTFVVIALLGLLVVGLHSNHDSEEQIQASNFASMLITLRKASPTKDIPTLPNLAIPTVGKQHAADV